MQASTSQLGDALRSIVGDNQVFSGDDIGERYRVDISRKYHSVPAFAVRPASTEEVSAIVKLAAEHRVPITVIGGQTGTSGAAVPADGGIALSLERMNRILELDAASMTMTVEAGCVLQVAQEAAEADGMLLPLDLGARGSAMVGGVIGTNAGGNRVLRWGMMRDMVIGLEAVLADGTIVTSLTKMLKDNAGYHWKHLLIGSEGTLGIVTRAVLRLRPLPTTTQTALVAMDSFEDAVTVLRQLEVTLSSRLSSFELLWNDFYTRLTDTEVSGNARPIPADFGYYAVVEAMGGDAEGDDAQFERALATLLENGVVQDAVIAQSERERQGLWAIREHLEKAFAKMRPFRSYDVSMSLSDMPTFVDTVKREILEKYPDTEMIFYGHAGDGNVHPLFHIPGMDEEATHFLDNCVFGAVQQVGGSISAEHGIGVTRAPYLARTRTLAELELMKTLKRALDPNNLLNPGKLLDACPDIA